MEGGVVGVVTQFWVICWIVRVGLRGQLEPEWLWHGEVEGDLGAVIE